MSNTTSTITSTTKAAVGLIIVALLSLGAGQAAAADASCVWSEALQRWVCVPP